MGKISLILILSFMVFLNTNAQLSADLALGSQSTFQPKSSRTKLQYFSISPSLKYTGPRFMVKVGLRQGLPTNVELRGTIRKEDSFGNTTFTKGKIGAKLTEKGFGFGTGYTFVETDSKTRPYLMFEYYRVASKLTFDETSADMELENSLNGIYKVSGRTIELKINQVRFGAGIQFQIQNKWVFFNEAFIGINNEYGFYTAIFAIDLGIRYLLTK